MSSSCESGRSSSYLPMEFPEVGGAAADESALETAEGEAPKPEAVPSLEEMVAARVEEARRTIAAQARQETERELQLARQQIAKAIERFAAEREGYFRKAEGEVVNLAMAIARRLLHRESQIDPKLLAGLVNYELEQLDEATKVRLSVSPEAVSDWRSAASGLAREAEIMPDKALAAGEVRIETALGATTVSLEREMKEIERGFFDLLAHRPQNASGEAARVQ